MKLKSLEIEGFKSFADKTLISFDGCISGIVGPNGCGKSNVVDAIRWVLGEQSSKNLRGKSMDDVIFSGSSERGPASAAHVELTLVTEGAPLPPPYGGCGAISVGRKLFRNGISEYSINRQPARLKDVRDLFLGSGVGVNAYSIIEQGKVGEIVTAKPEDRRRIIEEAAGISRFQMRKLAAERRMEATGQNLLRLKDVLSELERQKNSLERQAKKAEKFKVVRDELKTLDLTLATRDHMALTEHEKAHLDQLKEGDGVLFDAEARLTEHENSFVLKRVELMESQENLGEWQQKVYEIANAHTLTETMLKARRSEMDRLFRDREAEDVRLQDIRQNLLKVQQQMAGLTGRSVEVQLDLAENEEKIKISEERLAVTHSEAAQLFADLESARANATQSGHSLARLTAQRQSAEKRKVELDAERESLTGELTDLSLRLKNLDGLIHRSQSGLTDVRQQKLVLEGRSEELGTEAHTLENHLEAEKQALSDIKETLLQKKSRLDSLRELERNFEGYHDGPRSILEKRREGHADYVLGTVADFVETEPEYENAVLAVLGERMQGLIVNHMHESLSATELLRGLGTGRGSFVALDGLVTARHPVYVRELPQGVIEGQGVRGQLARFVKFREGFESLKATLLGDYLLVENLPQAMALWQDHRLPVVTPEGDLITREGVLSAGSPELTSRALLEKKREIKQLTNALQHMVNEVKAREEDCLDLTRKLKTIKAELDDMQKNHHVEDLKITEHEKDIQIVLHQRDGLEENRKRLTQKLMANQNESARLALEIDGLLQQEKEQNKLLSHSEKLILTHRDEEGRFQARMAECHSNLTQAKVQGASLFSRHDEIRREEQRLLDEGVRLAASAIVCEEKIILFAKLLGFVEERIRFLNKNLARILSAKTGVECRLDEAKSRHAGLEKEIQDLEISLKTERSEIGRVKDEINTNSLGLNQVRSNLTRLRDQIQERYQLFLNEVFQDYLHAPENFDEDTARVRAEELRGQLARAGNVNLEAIDELQIVSERFAFLNHQKEDLEVSLDALKKAIEKINGTTRTRFRETFDLINEKFGQIFPKLFNGGEAYLKLTDPENILESGVEIIAQPPGKKLQNITLLSGGEKALTAVSLLFAIFLIRPSPFCLLDEVDAPLDDANVDRYNDIVSEMSERTQFIVITHNKRTMQVTRTLFGVTMQKPGISQIVSVSLN